MPPQCNKTRGLKKKKSQIQFLLPTLMIENPIYLHYKVTVSRGLSGLLTFYIHHSSHLHSGSQFRLFTWSNNDSIAGLCLLILCSLLIEHTTENNRIIKVMLSLVLTVLLSSIRALQKSILMIYVFYSRYHQATHFITLQDF